MRDKLLACLTCLAEALIWVGCIYAAELSLGLRQDLVGSFVWLVPIGWGFAFLLFVTRFIPNKTYSRTARRNEVVACAMKTALAFCVLFFAVFTERTPLQFLSCLFFCIVLTIERLILNSWFIRYCMRPAHLEHAVLICHKEETWQQQTLQQNTYGLKMNRLEIQQEAQMQAVQMLTDFLTGHPETKSVYCNPSALQAAELEAIAHICHEQNIVLHLLPLSLTLYPKQCKASAEVLSTCYHLPDHLCKVLSTNSSNA